MFQIFSKQVMKSVCIEFFKSQVEMGFNNSAAM